MGYRAVEIFNVVLLVGAMSCAVPRQAGAAVMIGNGGPVNVSNTTDHNTGPTDVGGISNGSNGGPGGFFTVGLFGFGFSGGDGGDGGPVMVDTIGMLQVSDSGAAGALSVIASHAATARTRINRAASSATVKLDAAKKDLDDKITELSEKRGVNPGQLYATLQKSQRLSELERGITEDKVFSWLSGRNTIESRE